MLGAFVYKKAQKDIKQGFVFATYYRITTLGENTIMPQIEDIFAEVNAKMSVFQTDSEINKLNDLKANQILEISDELLFILQESKAIYEKTQGAFDPTLGTLIDLWGFGIEGKAKELSPHEVETALQEVGIDKIILSGKSVYKTRDKLRLNLSAIAKGYAVDRVAKLLEESGYDNFLVDIGGEIYAKGTSSLLGSPWKVAIQNPDDKTSALMSFELDSLAIATSGDYEKYIEKDGERYNHTIDSTTGFPVKNKLASVSVFDKSAMIADAYATALMAMGETKAISFAKENNIKAIFFIREMDSLTIQETNH